MCDHSLTCTVKLTVGGEITPQPISIQWIELDYSNKSEILADCNETVKVSGRCAANTNNTSLAHSYRCTAKYFGLSNYSDVLARQVGSFWLPRYFMFISQLIVPHLWTELLTFLQQKFQPLRTLWFTPALFQEELRLSLLYHSVLLLVLLLLALTT